MKQMTAPTNALSFKSLGKLWPWLRPNKRLVIAGSCMMPIVALISMIQPLTVQRAIDEGILKGDLNRTIYWATACLALSLASYVFAAVQSLTTATAVHRMIRDLRTALVSHVLKLAPAWHDHQISGALATRATSDFDTLSESFKAFYPVLSTLWCLAAAWLVCLFSLLNSQSRQSSFSRSSHGL